MGPSSHPAGEQRLLEGRRLPTLVATIILAHEAFLSGEAKTAEALLRYGNDPVACIIDEAAPPEGTTHRIPGADPVRVVPTIEQGLETGPDRLIIGVAPVGGKLPPAWRDDVAQALEEGVSVESGLHDRLKQDESLSRIARENNARIHDVREPPDSEPIYAGKILDIDALVVLTVGTDCSSGKMTTTVELDQALQDRGHDVAFAATGQTGIMLDPDAGTPIDAVPSDFVAGHAEQLVLDAQQARNADIVLVEGQGALTHPAYAGVSLGLLHGATPHAVILCHDAQREHKTATFHDGRRFPVNPPHEEWRLIQDLAEPLRSPTLAGVSIMNPPLPPEQDKALPNAPIVDILHDGPDRLAKAVEALF